jgi:quercetin dioxygenase-like cupin family protein
MAMEDALVLAEELFRHSCVGKAVRAYAEMRVPRTGWVQKQCRVRNRMHAPPGLAESRHPQIVWYFAVFAQLRAIAQSFFESVFLRTIPVWLISHHQQNEYRARSAGKMNSNESFTGSGPELIDMVGARFEAIARMGTGDADTALFRARMAAGKVVPLHSHIDPECFYVLSGRIEVFVLNDVPSWRTVETGHSLLVANGVKHAVRNTADQSADMILATNNRLARYFREAGRLVKPGTEILPPTVDDIQRMIRLSEAYGYWIASPAESATVTG